MIIISALVAAVSYSDSQQAEQRVGASPRGRADQTSALLSHHACCSHSVPSSLLLLISITSCFLSAFIRTPPAAL